MSTAGAVLHISPGAPAAPRPLHLPGIREELKLLPGAPNPDATPAWTIQDPVRNIFFRIGWLQFEMLLNWHCGDAHTLVRTVNAQTTLNVTLDDVAQLQHFLSVNELLRVQRAEDVARLRQRHEQLKKSAWQWLLHNYLFFRVPLLRPQRWLAASAPYLGWLFSRTAALLIIGLTLLGIYLVSRQWDVFTHTLVDHMTWSGVLGYAAALVIAKTLHELGHAYTATRHGVRVAHMGVAFLVMFPMLYTDTGESWRLKDPRHRLSIASAGIVVELALAGLSTLAWCLTPDGPLRNGLFFLATTSWVLTLAINASPFMRFDGYFITSDLLDLPNLHERSGALARTWMRRFLLGWRDPWPEEFTPPRRRLLIAFALITWLYRLIVFLGIALMVYWFFFKVLGLFLMAVELVWFIGRPVLKELRVWRARAGDILPSRWRLGAVGLIALLVLLFFPWSTRVQAHGWMRAAEQQALYSPFAAQISTLPTQRRFRRDDVVLALESKALGFDQEKAQHMAQARERQMQDLMGLPDGEQLRRTLASQKAMHEAQAHGSSEQISRLQVRAPFDGELHDLDPELAPGVWIEPKQPLAMLVNPSVWVVDAYIEEVDLGRVAVGQPVRVRQLIEPVQWLQGRVALIELTRTQVLPTLMLDARYGGPIAVVNPRSDRQPASAVTRDAVFRVRIEFDAPLAQQRISLVRAQIEAESESVFRRAMRNAFSVFVRESGF